MKYVEDLNGYLGWTRLDPSIPVRGLSPRSLLGHEPCSWLSCADYILVGIAPFIFAPELSSVQCVLLTFSLILDLFPIVCLTRDQIVFTARGGAYACTDDVGTYQWALDGKTLTLTTVEDPCPERNTVSIAHPWIKQD